jgi:hypothetical protein
MTARVEHDAPRRVASVTQRTRAACAATLAALLDLATDLAIIPAAACGPFIMWSMTP